VFLALFTTVGGVFGASGSGISLKRGLEVDLLENLEEVLDMAEEGSGEAEEAETDEDLYEGPIMDSGREKLMRIGGMS